MLLQSDRRESGDVSIDMDSLHRNSQMQLLEQQVGCALCLAPRLGVLG